MEDARAAEEQRGPARVSAVVVFAALAAVLGLTWWQQYRGWSDGGRDRVQLATDQAASHLEDYVRDRLLATAGMALTPDAIDDDDVFRERALLIQSEFGGFQAINRVSAAGEIVLATPEGPNREALGRNVLNHPIAQHAFRRTQTEHAPHMTDALELFQGGRGVAVYFPIGPPSGVRGYVNGVFRVRPMVRAALRGRVFDGYEIELRDDAGAVLLAPDDAVPEREVRPTGLASIDVLDRRWALRLTPGDTMWEQMQSTRLDGVFVLALLLLGLVSGLLYAARMRDITEVAKARERLDLQHRLENASKMESLGRLAGGVAHDFNNILTVILASADLLRPAAKNDARAKAALEGIVDASVRASALTEQLLSFARHTPTAPVLLDINVHITGLRKLLQRLTRDGVELRITPSNEPLGVVVAASHITQIVVNLVVNAVEAVDGDGEVTVRTERSGEQVYLTVADTGHGMDSATRHRIFEPFFTTKGAEGTGLGLATVYGIVQGYVGAIDVESAPQRGTLFRVKLPLAHADGSSLEPGEDERFASLEPTRATSEPSGPGLELDNGGFTLLLVDDDPAIRGALELGLLALGHDVVTAVDGQEALERWQRDPSAFTAIITDVLMPRLDGEQLLLAVRADAPALPVVVYSGHTDRSRTLSADAHTLFLSKPCTALDLQTAVSSLLDTDAEAPSGVAATEDDGSG